MKTRMFLMLTLVAVFIAVIGGVKYTQIQAAIAQHGSFVPPPETVTTVVAKPSEWATDVKGIGTVVAVHGVTVSADLPGVVDRISFESGASVRAGTVLLELDTRQERAQLAGAEAKQELARLEFERMQGLLDKGVVSQAEFDRAAAGQAQWQAQVREARATIDRKTIRAPFAGVLGLRRVNRGQYLASGAAIVSLQSLDPLYVDFSVPQQEVSRLRAGAEVRVVAAAGADTAAVTRTGRITAVDSVVDDRTRNIRVQATFDNPDGALHPGMFVEVVAVLGSSEAVVAVPASAINYAAYGDSVFIVAEMKNPNGETYRGAEQKFVKLGRTLGDQVAVLSGVEAGQEVVTSGTFKLHNGSAVVVNNAIQPSNESAPTPRDN